MAIKLPKMGNAPAANQRDKGLAFNGQDNGSSQRASMSKVQVNQHTGHMNDGRDVQFAQAPLKKGASFGKTANGGTATAPILGHTGMPVKSPANPDKIQMRQLANRTGNKCD